MKTYLFNIIRNLRLGLVLAVAFTICLITPTTSAASEIKFLSKKINIHGIQRHYDIYTPKGLGDNPSLVIVLHGGWITKDLEKVVSGKNPGPTMSKMTGRGWEKIANTHNAIVVYPAAVNSRWNDGSDETKKITHNTDDVLFISKIIDTTKNDFQAHLSKVYVTGFSNGAKMSYRLACELGYKISAIAPVDAGMPKEQLKACSPNSNKMPILLMHGDTYPKSIQKMYNKRGIDPVQLWEDTVKFWLARNECNGNSVSSSTLNKKFDGTSIVKKVFSDCFKGNVTVVRINGGGHAWPGGTQYLPKFLIGKRSKEINGANLIWNFFISASKKI